MANEEHLEILKQGVEIWNTWREENPHDRVDLSSVDLEELYLKGINFRGTDLHATNLSKANLSAAKLVNVDFSGADLNRVDFSHADLSWTNLSRANLSEANFNGTKIGLTTFVDVDLSTIDGLITVKHWAPSHVGIDTIYRSKGKIPEIFLRGVGIPDTLITYIASLTGEAIQYYSCFICYSSKNETFAQRLHADLQQQGVRCWFALEDMKIGDKIRPRIDESIRIHDKLLLILSENSLNSFWVESEVEKAFEEERKRNQTVLFPVRLDEAVMETDQAWAADIRRTRHIGDFSRWKDQDAYQQAFERLLRDLKAEG